MRMTHGLSPDNMATKKFTLDKRIETWSTVSIYRGGFDQDVHYGLSVKFPGQSVDHYKRFFRHYRYFVNL